MANSLSQARAIASSMNVTSTVSVSNPSDFMGDSMLVIAESCNKFIERVQNNIRSQDLVVTGEMQNIDVRIQGSNLQIECNPWLMYQDQGVRGVSGTKFRTPYSYKDKMPPVDVFKKWIQARGIQVTVKAGQSEEQALTSAAWAMSRKIYEKGIKPKKIFQKEIPELIEDLGIDLSQYTATQVRNLIAQSLVTKVVGG